MRRASFDDEAPQERLEIVPGKRLIPKRTNYRCAAIDCPNTGTIDDRGENNPGRCYWHWIASPRDWPSVTAKILSSPSMRNHGNVQVESTQAVLDLQQQSRNTPRGMRNMNTGGQL